MEIPQEWVDLGTIAEGAHADRRSVTYITCTDRLPFFSRRLIFFSLNLVDTKTTGFDYKTMSPHNLQKLGMSTLSGSGIFTEF
jgi:hypothetical protein